MGAKQKITQAPTMTPEQQALLQSMIAGTQRIQQGQNIGGLWGGPGSMATGGIGGQSFGSVGREPGYGGNPQMAALGAARAPQASNPKNMDPFGLAGYSNREQMVAPIVNPFRRNIGG